MTQKAVNNAKVLYRLNISRSDVEETHKIFTKAPFLLETLTNPVVSEEAKEVVLDKIARQSGMPEVGAAGKPALDFRERLVCIVQLCRLAER